MLKPPARVCFFGRVHPERAAVSIKLPGFSVKLIDTGGGLSGEFTTSIELSQVHVLYFSEQEEFCLATLKNVVEDSIRLQVDILGFTSGCRYDVEITHACNLMTFEESIFGVGIPVLMDRQNKRFEELLPLFSRKESDYLRRCLADLREAMGQPKDTGELCFRAIETLRQYFIYANNLPGDDSKKSWEIMRDQLGIERKPIDEISKYALQQRHGGTAPISDEERAQIFSKTWSIVDRFIDYAKNDYKRILAEKK